MRLSVFKVKTTMLAPEAGYLRRKLLKLGVRCVHQGIYSREWLRAHGSALVGC